MAEVFTSGHGSPFVAQVSMANAAKLYKAMLDGLEYRGTAFFQAYTTCQPEHGVGDNMSADQAKLVRDARGMPEFVFNPRRGETSQEAFDLKGNPSVDRDWWRTKYATTGEEYNFGVAHWALTEGRFRKHVKAVTEEEAAGLEAAGRQLLFITQDDVIHRRVFDPAHRSFVTNFGCYIKAEEHGKMKYYAVSPPDGAVCGGAQEGLEDAAEQGRRHQQGLSRAEVPCGEGRQGRDSAGGRAGEGPRADRRRAGSVK